MIYITLLIICSLTLLPTGRSDGNIRFFFHIFTFLSLWMISSLRIDIGTDYVNYVTLYDRITSVVYSYDFKTEPLYYAISIISDYVGGGTVMMFSLVAFITLLPIYLLKDKTYFSILLFAYICVLFLPSLSLIRQAAAVSFLIPATLSLIRGEKKHAFFMVVIASGFHYSALLFIPFFIVREIKISPVIGMAGVIFFWLIIDVINLPQIILTSPLLQQTKYGVYATNMYNESTEMGSGLGVILKMLPSFIFISFASLFGWINKSNEVVGARLVILLNYAYILSTILSAKIRIFNRLSDFLLFVPIVTIVFLARNINLKGNRIIVVGTICLLLFINFCLTIYTNRSENGSGLGIYPYKWMLS